MWFKTDKSRNQYKIDPSLYMKILHNKIIKKYKLDDDNTDYQINRDTYNFTNKLNIKNKLGKQNRKKLYIYFWKIIKRTLKIINRQGRLTWKKKTQLGLLSKSIIQNIVIKISDNSKYMQWKNSVDIIRWLKNIKYGKNTTFILFNIIDFYPSINQENCYYTILI